MQEIYAIDWKNNFIFFCEDNFSIKIKRTKEILDTIIKSGVNNKIYFSCQSRVDTLHKNPWLITLMAKAGMRQIFLGIETVHQQSLDAMNKQNTTPKMTEEVVNMIKDHGISIFGGVIIGYPGETREMVHQTIQFTKSLKLTCVQFTPITAFPGTEFFNEMKAKGMVTSYNYKHYNLFHPMMRTDQLTNIEVCRLVAEAYASYYLGSGYIKDVTLQQIAERTKSNKFKEVSLKIRRISDKSERNKLKGKLNAFGEIHHCLPNCYLNDDCNQVLNGLIRYDDDIGLDIQDSEYPPMSTYLSPVKFNFRRQKWHHLAKNLKYNP